MSGSRGTVARVAAGTVVVLLAVVLAVPNGDAASPHAQSQAGAKVPHVVLKRGTLLGEPWHTTLQRHRPDSKLPCFGVTTQDSEFQAIVSECGHPRRFFVPLIMSDSGDPDNRGVVTLLVTPPKVKRVHLNFGGRPDKTVWPKRISHRKARKAGVKPNFRYKSFARKGEFCPRGQVGYTASGKVFYGPFHYPPCRRQKQESKSERSSRRSSPRWQEGGYLHGFGLARSG